MKVKIVKYVPSRIEEEVDFSYEELVNYIVEEEGDYFLDYESDEMFEEFCSYACDLVEDEDVLRDHEQEIVQCLIDVRDRLNENNYNEYVENLVDFIKETVVSDFDDNTCVALYGKVAKGSAFKQAIIELYNEYGCSEDPLIPYNNEKVE